MMQKYLATTTAVVLTFAVENKACPYLSGMLKKDSAESSPHRFLKQTGKSGKCRGNGVNKFCYSRTFDVDTVPPFVAEFADLVGFSTPSEDLSTFNYMEDSQTRRDVLDGFALDNKNPVTGAAGYTYLGQFLSHDIQLDETSTLGEIVDPTTLPNFNTAMLDLDTLYGLQGSEAEAEIADGKFVIGTTDQGQARDFPRNAEGEAKVADPRNDEHRIISQIAVAFMVLHNKFYDHDLCKDLPSAVQRFRCAKRETVRAWQSVILTDLLPNLLQIDVLLDLADESKRILYTDVDARQLNMPVEFATAAYRLFHSRARGRYRLNSLTDGNGNQRARLFDVGLEEPVLTGGTKLPDLLVIEWDRFFGPKSTDPTLSPKFGNVARIMDMLYSRPMMQLPIGSPGTPGEIIVVECDASVENACPIVVDNTEVREQVVAPLAAVDLIRAQTLQVPGGIAFATKVQGLGGGNVVYSMEDMENGNVFGLPAGYNDKYDDVPLLLYLAHESIFEHGGQVLGRLGSRIIAETMYGIIEGSPDSILESPGASPITGGSTVGMEDVFKFIGWLA